MRLSWRCHHHLRHPQLSVCCTGLGRPKLLCKRLLTLSGLISNGLGPLLLVLSCICELKLTLGSSVLNPTYLLLSFSDESLVLSIRFSNRAFGSGLSLLCA